VPRIILFATDPEPMQEHGELSSNSCNSPLLCAAAASCGYVETPTAKIAVWAKVPKDIVSRLNEEPPHEFIATLTDPKLKISLAGLVLPRTKAQV
jgi:hypothetical protein